MTKKRNDMNEKSTKLNVYKKQFQLEKILRKKLLESNKNSRRHLYREVYDQFFDKTSHKTVVNDKVSQSDLAQTNLLKQFLNPNSSFLEIGPGDCSLSINLAKSVKKVYALDVSRKLIKNTRLPTNFQFIISQRVDIPLPNNSIDLTFSNQFMEHIHPNDALNHLQNVYKALIPKGHYICITPNRLNGPHDVSKFFNESEAMGLHLKEYKVTELDCLFRKAGFSDVKLFIEVWGNVIQYPTLPTRLIETSLGFFPNSSQKRIANLKPFVLLLGILMIGKK